MDVKKPTIPGWLFRGRDARELSWRWLLRQALQQAPEQLLQVLPERHLPAEAPSHPALP